MFERPSTFRRFACAYSCSLVFVAPPEERVDDEPELVRRAEPEVDRDLVVDGFEVDRDFVPELEPPLRDFEAELELPLLDLAPEVEPLFRDFVRELEPLLRDFVPEPEPEPLRREPDDDRELDERPRPCDCCCEPRESASSFESSSDPRSFLPTPTAAAVARPTAAPVATFFGVDIPSVSEPSSSAMVSPPSPR
jgi:hypothetical protein